MKYLMFVLLSGLLLNAQTLRINEVVSSNSVYFDEDGDTPDWIELHNFGTQTVNLENWSISDDLNNLSKWNFPNVNIPANDYLLLWASDKDRVQITASRTLVNQGDLFNYLIPNSEPDANWTHLDFNDSSWDNGSSGFGYADGDDTTLIPNGTLSVYLRKEFSITNVDDIITLILDIDYDDAFVAYINGVEIARDNINGAPPPYNASTILDHEAQMYNGGLPDRFSVTDFSSILVEGTNLLAIQAHNVSSNSSDFTVIPFLSAIYSTGNSSGIDPPEILNLIDNNTLHTNFKISTTSETLTLSDNNGTIIDQLLVEGLTPDTSIGVSNFSNNIVSYLTTTPNAQNADNEFIGTIQNEIIFSENGGLKEQPISLSLFGNETGHVIRYTLDGSKPNAQSLIFSGPIQITENTSVRAQIYASNYLPSKVATESYIIGASHDIDVLLLSADPDDFFDEDNGIYVYGPEDTYQPWDPFFGANFWEDWERPVHFSFYENNSNESVKFNGGVKIFGGWSRGQNGQRSLSFFARGQYGDSKFEHSFFDNVTYNDFEAFIIRNSGQDWLKSSMKDIMLTSLMRGSELDFQEYNPVATYINGEYWGMYNMREKINEHMLASKHNLNADEITLLTNNAEVIEGSNQEYIQLIDYINSNDLSNEANFEYIRQRIDLKQYALYQASNIFFNNTDWPGNNIKFWKHPDTKWRWIMYDTDFGFGPFWNISNYNEDTLSFALYPDGPGWPNPPWSTLLFRKLITNIAFRNQFINRYADELNTRFLPNNVTNHIDQIYATIEPEVFAHYNRWKDDPSVEYEVNDIFGHVGYFIDNMKSFGINRHPIVKEHIKQQFDLPNFHPITITNLNTSEGFVEVNENLHIQEGAWTGDYFETVPVKLTAIAEFGYEFSHWSGNLFSNNETIEVALTGAFEVIPNFTSTETSIPIVINEINYKSSPDFNADDWIELYNPNSSSVDLSNWQIKDNDDTHIFTIPEGTQIEGEDFLIFVKDASDFINVFPNMNYLGELGFGLGGSDSVRLYNSTGTLQDEVSYESNTPWPSCADETGYTLELITPDLDNTLPENWDCINVNGSPNAINSESLNIEDYKNNSILVYPNPVKSILYIGQINDQFDIDVYSILGQKVTSSRATNQLDLSRLEQGVYFVRIKTKTATIIRKVVKH
ncbi:MAG: CotH kinase family protein [Flavobacteriaceae bacterium]